MLGVEIKRLIMRQNSCSKEVTSQLGSEAGIKLMMTLHDNYHDRDVAKISGCLEKEHSTKPWRPLPPRRDDT